MTVLQQTEAVCSGRKEVKVTGTAQYILGGSQLEAIGEEAGCTYYLMAAPGQRLTISIINLSLNSSSALAGEDSEFSYGLLQLAHCTGFASVEEPDLGHRTDICASDRRASVAYESQTDRLLLRFVEETTRELFLIKVQGTMLLLYNYVFSRSYLVLRAFLLLKQIYAQKLPYALFWSKTKKSI